jgi:hypothetical protein
MATLLAPYAYVPARLPKGVIYIDWKHGGDLPAVIGEVLTIDLDAPGDRQIEWSASRGCDAQYHVGPCATGYPGDGFDMAPTSSAVIAGRLVYFSPGNHGSNAWTSFPITTSGTEDWVSVGLWESNFISPAQAMTLVAQAVPADGVAAIPVPTPNPMAQAKEAARPVFRYFQALNDHDYLGMWLTLTPSMQRQVTVAHLTSTEATSHVSDIVLHFLGFPDPQTSTVFVTFTSTQAAAFGPNGDTRDHWTLTYTLRYISGRWLITPPKGLAAAHNAYGKSIEENRKMYALESYCYINQFDMSAYSMYGKQLTALLNKGNDEWETYRLAFSVAAAKLGVKIPWKWDLACREEPTLA